MWAKFGVKLLVRVRVLQNILRDLVGQEVQRCEAVQQVLQLLTKFARSFEQLVPVVDDVRNEGGLLGRGSICLNCQEPASPFHLEQWRFKHLVGRLRRVKWVGGFHDLYTSLVRAVL